MVRYKKVNQWKIYNLKTRRIYIFAFVRFYKNFSYYDISYEVRNKDNNSMKLVDIWNKADDKESDKVMIGK